MAVDQSANTLIRDLVLDVKAQEPKAKQKANTVTAAIGTGLTTVASLCALLLQSGLDLPEGTILIITVIGMVATSFAVSKTKNGVTESTADRLELELSRRIDLNHNHDDDVVAAAAPVEAQSNEPTDMSVLRAEAESLATETN